MLGFVVREAAKKRGGEFKKIPRRDETPAGESHGKHERQNVSASVSDISILAEYSLAYGHANHQWVLAYSELHSANPSLFRDTCEFFSDLGKMGNLLVDLEHSSQRTWKPMMERDPGTWRANAETATWHGTKDSGCGFSGIVIGWVGQPAKLCSDPIS